ncbi:molecular chaperone Hsp33 [Bhargavaea ullalensis]|uniref:Molecular chaperone Hsp33 n=1 Tax=Bhargavaea ullalensis TaxID=1265685 RepID=A0ABV2G808_9BACL
MYVLDNTDLLKEVYEMNQSVAGLPKQLLGKMISVMSILTGTLKGTDRISLSVTLTNRSQKLFTEADAGGNVRGYMNGALAEFPCDGETGEEKMIGGNGTIRVIKGTDLHQFTSITDMPNREITKDLENYFMQSDQTATHLAALIRTGEDGMPLSSHASYAQLLPGAPSHLLEEVKEVLRSRPELPAGINAGNLDKSLHSLRMAFPGLQFLGTSECRFFCGCTKEMFLGMLQSLSAEEVEEMIAQSEPAKAVCHVCGREHLLETEDLRRLGSA